MPPTPEQRRAQHAWAFIERIQRDYPVVDREEEKFLNEKQKKDNEKNRKMQSTYKREIKKLSTRIITSGLGQALAFLLAKGKVDDLLIDLGCWVGYASRETSPPNDVARDALLRRLCDEQATALRLRRDTAETLAYLAWLTRLADASLAGDVTADDEAAQQETA